MIFRYTDPELWEFLQLASCIDPRFKSMPYVTDAERKKLFKRLATKVVDMQKESLSGLGTLVLLLLLILFL